METITCRAKRVKVEEIEQVGGLTFTDILYRSVDGQYFLKSEKYHNPEAGREDLHYYEKVEEISEKEAMLWYVEQFLNDEILQDRFIALIEQDAPEPAGNKIVKVQFVGTLVGKLKAA